MALVEFNYKNMIIENNNNRDKCKKCGHQEKYHQWNGRNAPCAAGVIMKKYKTYTNFTLRCPCERFIK